MAEVGGFPAPPEAEESVGALFGRAMEEGKAFARSEVEVVKRGLQLRAARATRGLVLLVAALVVVHLSLIAGAVMLAIALATLVGPLASGLIVLVGGLAVGALLLKIGIDRISPAFGPIDQTGGSTTR